MDAVSSTQSAPESPSENPERVGRGLIGFYASCTVFGIAVSIAAVIWIVFGEMTELHPLAWAAAAVAVLSAIKSWHYLGVMRAER